MSWNRIRRRATTSGAFVGAVALLALAVAACTPATAVTVEQPLGRDQTGIAVTGTGRVFVQPDIAIIDAGVEVQAPTVAEAREAAAVAMEALRTAVLAEGVAERDLTTRWFNI